MSLAPVSLSYTSQGKDIESRSVQIGNSKRELAPSSVTFPKGIHGLVPKVEASQ